MYLVSRIQVQTQHDCCSKILKMQKTPQGHHPHCTFHRLHVERTHKDIFRIKKCKLNKISNKY